MAPRSVSARAALALLAACVVVPAASLLLGPSSERRLNAESTTVVVTGSPAEAWAALRSYDVLPGRALALAALGLPQPLRCTLDREGEGATRTCFFDVGRIEERVVTWDPPRRLDLVITEVDLPSARWIGFTRASYVLASDGAGGTRVTRTTEITSSLSPSLYFQPIERFALHLEHRRLLDAVALRTASGQAIVGFR